MSAPHKAPWDAADWSVSAPDPDPHHRTPSGWADDCLMMAYDLIYETMTTHGDTSLRGVLTAIEAADDLLAGDAA